MRRPLAREYGMYALQKLEQVIRLKDISAKEDARCARLNDTAYDMNHFLVGTSTAAAKNQDRNRTSGNHRAHGFRISGTFCLNYVGPQFSRDTRVQHDPFGVAGVLDLGPTRQRLHDERHSDSLALPYQLAHAPDLFFLELRIAAANHEKSDNCVGAPD